MSDHAQPFVLAGVMGWPVAHSRSPLIHSHWIAQYGLRGAYVPLPVRPEALEAALRALPVLGFAGCNLTIPHKIAAIDIVDALEPLAQRIGAANTIVVRPDGSLLGRNTDAFGIIANLREAQPQWRADAGSPVPGVHLVCRLDAAQSRPQGGVVGAHRDPDRSSTGIEPDHGCQP